MHQLQPSARARESAGRSETNEAALVELARSGDVDAWARLCLRAAADLRGACWRDYLEHPPRGIHKAQAEAAEASP